MNIDELKEKYNIVNITPLTKGWSKDKKYIVKDESDNKMLLRISNISLYEKKKKQFELLQKMESLEILCSRPIAFGILDENSCYTILSFLEGKDGIEAIKEMDNKEAYNLGIESGKVLKMLHSISIKHGELTWHDKYIEKMPRKLQALKDCNIQIPLQDKVVSFYKNNYYLMKNRPLTFCHGDYHLGNMIVNNGKIGIIDFDKNGIADPYDDFKPFCWNVIENEYFETGLINGYFDNNIPGDFFKILKFYTAEWLISHLPWAISFGEKEVATAIKVNDLQMKWWDRFDLDVPLWYKGINIEF